MQQLILDCQNIYKGENWNITNEKWSVFSISSRSTSKRRNMGKGLALDFIYIICQCHSTWVKTSLIGTCFPSTEIQILYNMIKLDPLIAILVLHFKSTSIMSFKWYIIIYAALIRTCTWLCVCVNFINFVGFYNLE